MNGKQGVLVLGAGAGADYNFPIGRKLVDYIGRESLRLMELVEEAISANSARHLERSEARRRMMQMFISELKQSGRESIDDFIGRRPDPGYQEIARHLVAAAIHQHQTSFAEHLSLNRPSGWYAELFEWLYLNSPPDAPPDNVKIITFNYDLSLQMQLANMRRTNFGGSWEAAWGFAQALPIVHAHGNLHASVDLEPRDGKIVSSLNAVALRDTAASMRLVCPRNAERCTRAVDTTTAEVIRDWLSKADVVAFLGYGFHASNNTTLGLGQNDRSMRWDRKELATTCFEWKPEETARVNQVLGKNVAPPHGVWECSPALGWFRLKMTEQQPDIPEPTVRGRRRVRTS